VTTQFWPERLELVDEFPTTPSGKVQKYKLREGLRAPAARVGSG
jgi:cyclohexanecarboxylate-CoA ligase